MCPVCSVRLAMYNVNLSVCCAQCFKLLVCPVQSAVCSGHWFLCSVQFSVCSVHPARGKKSHLICDHDHTQRGGGSVIMITFFNVGNLWALGNPTTKNVLTPNSMWVKLLSLHIVHKNFIFFFAEVETVT